MSEVVLSAEVREVVGKHAKHARAQGKVPGVYYAHGEKSINIQVQKPALDTLVFTHETHIIELKLPDGSSKKCILRDVQFDPVSDKPIHFDLQGLRENEKLTIEIPVVLTGGIPKGVREGGVVQQMVHKVKISCMPKDIPEKIEINIAELGINQTIHVRDLNIPNVTVLDSPEISVVGVLPPVVEKVVEPTVAAEEALQEPEVLGKGKKVEEGEETAEAAPAKAEVKEEKGKEKEKKEKK